MNVRRRDFITVLGGAAFAAPLAVSAQQPAIPVIGVLGVGGEQTLAANLAAIRRGLNEMGFVEGGNFVFEVRGTEQFNRLPGLAAELVRRRVAIIYTISNANAAQAANAATATIPIVFTVGPDPVALGLVPSFNRPGGNVTGITYYGPALAPKRLELLRELVPEARTVAFLVNRANSSTEGAIADMKVAAGSVGQQIIVVSASTTDEIDSAFAAAARQVAGTFLVCNDGLFTAHRAQLVALAARYRIPASYFNRGFAEAGGLMSYADDRSESLREAASYIGRILKGEKPSDLPVLQPTKFDLAINVKTAKSLGLTFPPSFYLRADEVI